MAGQNENKRFLFFKYVPPKKGDKPLKDEEYIKKAEADAPEIEADVAEVEADVPEVEVDIPKAKEVGTPDSEMPEASNYWDFPQEPDCPELPEFPETPECPEPPEMPECPELPELPELPECPEIPECPEPPEVPEGPCPEDAIMHVIQAGDTFWKLAKKYGTSVESIEAANPDLDPLNLQIGETICVPAGIPGAKG